MINTIVVGKKPIILCSIMCTKDSNGSFVTTEAIYRLVRDENEPPTKVQRVRQGT
jgi:hypothetical protein